MIEIVEIVAIEYRSDSQVFKAAEKQLKVGRE